MQNGRPKEDWDEIARVMEDAFCPQRRIERRSRPFVWSATDDPTTTPRVVTGAQDAGV
jgi:hypothetical protein